MPYFITDEADDCNGWATIKEDGTVIGCHNSKQDAIDQMVAVSIEEDIEPGGERKKKKRRPMAYRVLPDNYRPALSPDVPEGRACGNCFFYDESNVMEDAEGLKAWCERWDDYVLGDHYCNAWQADEEVRQVNLSAPAFMRNAARRGLRLNAEGHGGDGLTEKTLREARDMADGNISEDKWRRIAPWVARHMVDLDAAKNTNPNDPEYPGPGLVAHLLWGSGGSKTAAQRTADYAQGVVDRLDREQEESPRSITMKGTDMKKNLEVRVADFSEIEMRATEEGGPKMSFRGYAAVFNSPSEPLPFIERIAPGAFKRSLRSRNEIKMFVNHNMDRVLGSTRAGTLRLTEDEKGLLVEADLPDTTDGRDLSILLERGDVSSMSFGFTVPPKGDKWSEDGMERTLTQVRLHEVSVVTGFPAYEATTASVRNLTGLAQRTNVDADALTDALTSLEAGKTLTLDQASMVRDVVAQLEEPAAADAPADDKLNIMRKQLDLLFKAV
jgi:HK97 family phage prohead protease